MADWPDTRGWPLRTLLLALQPVAASDPHDPLTWWLLGRRPMRAHETARLQEATCDDFDNYLRSADVRT